MSLQRGASLKPQGDVLTVRVSNDGMEDLCCLLDRHGIGQENGSVMTTEPRSIISSSGQEALDRETNEMAWQEMAYQLRQESNVGGNYVMTMLLAGAVAAAGLWTDTLHIVIGAMVIAPGFEPIIRIPFGLMGRSGDGARQGLVGTALGYAALAIGAALALVVLQAIDPSPVSLGERHWVQYWSSVQPSSVLIALVAGAAGAVTIASGRSVLTAGVMIALALIPAMSIAGMAVAAGDLALAGKGFVRWATDAACVAFSGGGLFMAKRMLQHPRTS
ncbi:DUF389 domain-containing protein [Falsiroseomonas sp.]|uniref:DUF389 domain-containing protein n=1 Tax=Falsiroseomonas sp. TaxID=2870721 RepID=UPI003563380F